MLIILWLFKTLLVKLDFERLKWKLQHYEENNVNKFNFNYKWSPEYYLRKNVNVFFLNNIKMKIINCRPNTVTLGWENFRKNAKINMKLF